MNWYDWYMSWNFYHLFVFQYKMLKQVLWIFRRLKRFFKIFFKLFFWPSFLFQASTSRLVNWHSRLGMKSVDRRAQNCARLADNGTVDRTGRPGWELCSLFVWVDRSGRPGRELCSLFVWVDRAGRPQLPNGHISDRWRSTRAVDWQSVRLPAQPNG